MQVQKVDSQYNPNFGSVMIPKRARLSKIQEKIADTIFKRLHKPLDTLNGRSTQWTYKSKNDIDFEITSYNSIEHTVSLDAYKGIKFSNCGDTFTYTDKFNVGIYGKDNQFKLDDIEAAIKRGKRENNKLNAIFIVPLAGIAACLLATVLPDKVFNSKDTVKPLIENVDSVAKRAKQVLPDSTKILKSVRK